MPGPESRIDNLVRVQSPLRSFLSFLLLAAMFVVGGGADVPPRSQEQLHQMSSDIVLGMVGLRSMTETLDALTWQERAFEYEVRVEETLKGDLEQGEVIVVKARIRNWVGPEPIPPSDTGHHPLPLPGELAKFHLTLDEGDSTYSIVLPNGVELAQDADVDDPRRTGDLPVEPVTSEEETPAEEANRDPFGWDVLLLLLAIPLVIGGVRQQGRPRWILLGLSTVMLAGAAAIVLI